MTIKFACSCGQSLAARDEHAGRKVRCTACSQVVAVPDTPAAPAANVAPRRPAPQQAVSSRAEPPPRSRDDEMDFEPEEQPRRRRKKGGIPKIVLFGIPAVLLLGVGIFFLIKMLSGPSAAALAEFDLVPRDAQVFGTVRMAEVLKTDSGKKILAELRKDPEFSQMEKASGITAEDVERVTMVVKNAKEEEMWVVVKTAKAVNRKAILDNLKATEQRGEGKKSYFVGKGKGTAVWFMDESDKQIVIAPSEGSIKECQKVADNLVKDGPLKEYVVMAAKNDHHLVAAGQVPKAQMDELRDQAGPAAEMFGFAFDMKSAFMTAKVKDKIDLELGIEMTDKSKAEAAVKQIESLVAFARIGITQVPPAMKKEAENVVNQLKPKQDGTKVSINLSVDSGPLVTGLVQQIQQGGGGGRAAAPAAPSAAALSRRATVNDEK